MSAMTMCLKWGTVWSWTSPESEKVMFKGIFCPSITITDDEGKIDYDLWGNLVR